MSIETAECPEVIVEVVTPPEIQVTVPVVEVDVSVTPVDITVEVAGSPGPPSTVPGPPGPEGLNALGAWSPLVAYEPDDLVTSAGSSWLALAESTGIDPGRDTTTTPVGSWIHTVYQSLGSNPYTCAVNFTTDVPMNVTAMNVASSFGGAANAERIGLASALNVPGVGVQWMGSGKADANGRIVLDNVATLTAGVEYWYVVYKPAASNIMISGAGQYTATHMTWGGKFMYGLPEPTNDLGLYIMPVILYGTSGDEPWALFAGKGDEGVGVAAGGATGEYLTKKSATDYDTQWSALVLPANIVNGSGAAMQIPVWVDAETLTGSNRLEQSADGLITLRSMDTAGYGKYGLRLVGLSSGGHTVLQAMPSGGLYITDQNGQPQPLTLGTWANPNDGSQFTANYQYWKIGAGRLLVANYNLTWDAQMGVLVEQPNRRGLAIILASGQTAPAIEIRDAPGTVIFSVPSDGSAPVPGPFVDRFTNQTIAGAKTFTGAGQFNGYLTMGTGIQNNAPTAVNHLTRKDYVDARTPQITPSTTAPANPAVGDIWVDTN